ncbi:MAG: M15 family metallopeptidase [Myxococcaceae bacterium]|nr:M15 family metallopeptidase [Myxococcaceae bacterium]
MRFTIVTAVVVSLLGCGDPEGSNEELLDDEFGVDQNGLLVYPSTGAFEEEPPAGGFELPDPDAEPEELTAEELAQLPEDTAVLEEEGLVDPTLGDEAFEEGDDGSAEQASAEQALVTCGKTRGTGYRNGRAFAVTLVKTDYKPAGINAANAFYYMERAAARAGVSLVVNSGFRTMAQQRYLYNCYKTKRCNNGNLAARPGYSNHQSAIALDISTRQAKVYRWLKNNARRYGYVRTVPSEPWHWEYRGATRNAPCKR